MADAPAAVVVAVADAPDVHDDVQLTVAASSHAAGPRLAPPAPPPNHAGGRGAGIAFAAPGNEYAYGR